MVLSQDAPELAAAKIKPLQPERARGQSAAAYVSRSQHNQGKYNNHNEKIKTQNAAPNHHPPRVVASMRQDKTDAKGSPTSNQQAKIPEVAAAGKNY